MLIPLSHPVDIHGFHHEATRLLGQQVAPHTVQWTAAPACCPDAEPLLETANASIRNRAARAIIPQSFVRMSELVVLHRDPLRFDVLYRSLWRLVYEPELRHDFGDADLARLRQMAQSVRRDVQKMKSRMEFIPVQLKGNAVDACWYEPTHFIAELVGGWLARQDGRGAWVLLTPDRSLHWDGAQLMAAPGLAPEQQPRALSRDQWMALLENLPWF
ncbi:MAG: uracil-DNA glycosylase protein-like protein [Ramlibacter sp.]|nr:uracil-DNA glycosylase protein-like protein [Ramlibacter sp.]